MAGPEIPSYTQLVYDVVRESDEPLTVDQIVAAVNARRPITTKNPKTTIRNVLGNGWQLVSVGNRRYGYLPRLVNGSVLRIPLAGEETVSGPLAYPDEVRDALWPGFFENQSRRDLRPVQLTLPTGDVVALPLEQVPSFYRWGTQVVPDALREYLSQQQAQPDDSLVIRVVDGEAGRGEAEFSRRRDRDETAISQRNRLLADEVEHILRKGQARGRMTWEITIPLLARGYYQDPLAPDPLFTVLAADKRFVESGWGVWELTDTLTPEMVEMIEFNKALTEAMLESDAKLAMEDEPNVREYASSDEPLVFLDSLYPHGLPSQPSALTPLDRAQDLIYEAWETPNRRKRLRLARKALQISPDCADAYVILGNDSAHDAQEAADLYARGVAAGERALGSDVFDANVGYFWSILETRPYMRARGCLAEALWALGRRDEAIAHIWEMLRLNPGDNQGVRYWLLNWLLELGDDAGARRLLKQYPDEITAIWQYGRALQAFRTGGDSKRAQKLLTEAQMWNPFVPPYLLGTKRLPSELPQYYSLGQDSEAVYCAMSQMTVWLGTPGAIDWLRKRTA